MSDPRAWDLVVRLGRMRIAVEAETRPRDLQELIRRLQLKRRDGGVDRLVLLLLDSRANRAMLREAGTLLSGVFPVPSAVAIAALRDGQPPSDDALVLLSPDRGVAARRP